MRQQFACYVQIESSLAAEEKDVVTTGKNNVFISSAAADMFIRRTCCMDISRPAEGLKRA